MKKILKYLGILIAILILGLVITGFILHKPLPEGKESPEADALASKVLTAIGYEKYKNTRYLEWSYQGGAHDYKWDKKLGKVVVKWSGYTVNLNLNDTSKSFVSKEETEFTAKESKDIIETAWSYFNNDSFWLVAPFKLFDEGTKRSIVKLEDGSDALLISYPEGGSTPGDNYLWKLQPNGFPRSFQMWVQIIPVGGLEASWDDWQIMKSGTFLPKSHQFGPFSLEIGNPKAYN